MAEEVEISNVGGDGVASEVTLARLTATMESMAKQKGVNPAEITKKMKQVMDESSRHVVNNTKTKKENTQATKKATTATDKFSTFLTNSAGIGIKSIKEGFKGLYTSLTEGKDDLGDFTKNIPLVGNKLSGLVGIIDENLESFRNLSQSGAIFGEGLNNLRNLSAAAGLPLSEFSALVGQNSEVMKLFGGSVASGARNFAAVALELRTGPGKAMLGLGYTAQELNESLIEYAEFSQTQINTDRRNSKVTAAGAAEYLNTINDLAAVTGKRRDQIKEEMAAAQADQRVRLAIASMGKEEGQTFAANLAATNSAGLKEALKDAADGVLNNPLSQGLAVASETFRKDAANIKNMNAMEYQNFMAKVGKELDEAGSELGEGAQAVISSGTGFGQAVGMASELANEKIMDQADYDKAKAARDAEANKDLGIKEFSNTLRTVRSSLMDVLTTGGDNSPLSVISNAINSVAATLGEFVSSSEFTEGIKEIGNTISSFISNFKNFDLMTALFGADKGDIVDGKEVTEKITGLFDSNMFKGIGEALKDALLSSAGLIVGGIVAVFAAKTVISAIGAGISGALSSVTSKIFGKGPVSSDADKTTSKTGGIGKGIAGIGKGIGKGIGGVFGGLAKGISAFANPAVVAGAASLGAAIVLIGGAIAGATWMVGKALPTMAEGMKSFEEINGAALIAAGKGMAAIGAGLAVFGAGSTLGAVGNVISNILGALPGQSPLEKLQEFGDAKLNTTQIENNANAMMAYSKAMAGFDGGPAPSVLSAFKTGIVSLLGGETDPLAPIKSFGEMSFNTNGIITNASAVKAYADAMKDFPSSPSASVFGALKDGIISLLGGETDPFAPMKAFGDLRLNTQGIIGNAYALSSYADAMKDFPTSPSASVFGALKDGIIGLLGGNTDPMAPIKAFGEMSFNTNGIIANASAVKSYAEAMKDFPSSPSASVFGALKDGIIGLLGGNTDPMAPIKAFGEMSFNTNGIIANASAVKSYAEAMKDFPSSPSASVFTALKDGIISLLGGETDPFAPMKAFGDLSLDAAGIVTNAGAVKTYAEAMKDFPDAPSVSALSALKTGIVSLFGGETDPFSSLIEFGNLSLNSSGILNNAEAVKAYAQAMSAMPQIDGERTGGVVGAIAGFFSGDTQMPWDKVKAFGEADLGNTESILNNANVISKFNEAMAGISSSGGLMPIADGMTAIAGVQGLQSNLDILNAGLDTAGVVNYTVAMQNLVDTLQELNAAMSEERTANTKQQTTGSANSAMANITSSDAATSSNQLNTIMEQVLSVLHEMRDLDGKVEKNTRNIIGSNIARGSVSNVG